MSGGAYLYILLCADESYYTGTTRADLEYRVAQHNSGTYGWLHGHAAPRDFGVCAVVRSHHWCHRSGATGERHSASKTRVNALLSRAKKEALIRGEFERLPELSKRHQPPAKKGPR
jgi:putative endonuclease